MNLGIGLRRAAGAAIIANTALLLALLAAWLVSPTGLVGSDRHTVLDRSEAATTSTNYEYDAASLLSFREGIRAPTGHLSIRQVTGGARAIHEPATGLVAPEGGVDAAGLARGGVYTLRDEAGAVVRTGRTNDLVARQAAHFNDPVLGDFRFNVEYRTDVYAEQRGLEQVLYDQNPGARLENGGYNKIRGISPSNPNLGTYMQAAWDYLGRLGG